MSHSPRLGDCVVRLSNHERDCDTVSGGSKYIRSRLNMTRVVPQPDHRLGQVIMFIGQRTQARRAQQEVSTARRLDPEPASTERAQKMAAGKKQHVPGKG